MGNKINIKYMSLFLINFKKVGKFKTYINVEMLFSKVITKTEKIILKLYFNLFRKKNMAVHKTNRKLLVSIA